MSLQTLQASLAAGETKRIPIIGGIVQFYAASGDFEFGLEPGNLVPGRVNDGLEQPFDGIYLRNPTGAAITVDMRYGDEGVLLIRRDTIEFASSQPVDIQTLPVRNTALDSADAVLAAAAATLISAARGTKRQTIIKNPSSAATSIRVGGATVAAAAGVELEPGETITIDGSMAVYGYSVPGQTVSLMEVDKV